MGQDHIRISRDVPGSLNSISSPQVPQDYLNILSDFMGFPKITVRFAMISRARPGFSMIT